MCVFMSNETHQIRHCGQQLSEDTHGIPLLQFAIAGDKVKQLPTSSVLQH